MGADVVNEQVEAERLRHVRALIEELLREANVCGTVILAGREGRFENCTFLGATWSNLRIENHPDRGQFIGLRSKLADYAGDVERQQQHQAWSVGVVGGMAEILGSMALGWLEAAKLFDEQTGATHTPWKRDDPRDA